MIGPLRCVVFAGLVVVGSTGSTGCGDDSSMTGNDAAVGGGLVVQWSSAPATWPGTLADGVTVERAVLALDNLRIVGDAAPGDPRTTASGRELRWDDATQPADLDFPDAPSGVYSQLSLLIDGHVAGPSVELRGQARVNSVDYEFRITDDSPLAVTLSIDKTLQPPEVTTLGLRLNFAHALDALDFAMFDMDSGRLELENGDPQFALFRARLVESFEIAD